MTGHRTATLSILVVEDEWLIREVICLYLREVGCRILEAETGEQAIDYLRGSEPIDAVFTDIRLKGRLEGWDVGEAARELRGGIAVVYASASAPSPERQRQVAGSRFLSKPYNPSVVHRTCHVLAGEAGQGTDDRPPRNPADRRGAAFNS